MPQIPDPNSMKKKSVVKKAVAPKKAAPKMMKPEVAKRVSDRKAFVGEKMASKGIDAKTARKRFFVQTRVKEMQAKGKTVTPEMRKNMRKRFESGNVKRKGFAAPKKKIGGSSKPNPRGYQQLGNKLGYW